MATLCTNNRMPVNQELSLLITRNMITTCVYFQSALFMLTMKLKYSMFRSWRMHVDVVLGLAMPWANWSGRPSTVTVIIEPIMSVDSHRNDRMSARVITYRTVIVAVYHYGPNVADVGLRVVLHSCHVCTSAGHETGEIFSARQHIQGGPN